jgi:hypothetical protein
MHFKEGARSDANPKNQKELLVDGAGMRSLWANDVHAGPRHVPTGTGSIPRSPPRRGVSPGGASSGSAPAPPGRAAASAAAATPAGETTAAARRGQARVRISSGRSTLCTLFVACTHKGGKGRGVPQASKYPHHRPIHNICASMQQF